MGEWKDIVILLFGGGWAIQLIRHFVKKGEDKQILLKTTKDLRDVKEQQSKISERMNALEYSTAVKLATIETKLYDLSIDMVDIKKDIKLLLKANIHREEN
jgi:hypothetical protein